MLLAKGVIAAFVLGLATWFIGDLFSHITHGQAIVLDGDTLEFDEVVIDLHGIDAPEFQQTCQRGKHSLACGAYATAALLTRVYGKQLWCFEKGRTAEMHIVARCYVGLSDLAAGLVKEGWAFAIDEPGNTYKDEEGIARDTRRGVWSGDFVAPAIWRESFAASRPQP